MITLHKLKWSNCFSYGDNNEIDLSAHPITQLVGTNGAGKTSIPIIIQEALFGKNIKGIKKADIVNRYTGKNEYSINLIFQKYDTMYEINLYRKNAKLTLTLTENNEDISSHTAVETYKTISKIIGFSDFKMVSQLLYQSSNSNLEFLTATDANRKKFLVSLLNLVKYTAIHETFKEVLKDINSDVTSFQAKLDQTQSWLDTYLNKDLTPKEYLEELEVDQSVLDDIIKLQNDLDNIKEINKDIVQNNTLRKQLLSCEYDPAKVMPEYSQEVYNQLVQEKGSITAQGTAAKNKKASVSHLDGVKTCPTCKQDLDTESIHAIIEEADTTMESCRVKLSEVNQRITSLNIAKTEIEKQDKLAEDFIRLNKEVDHDKPINTLDVNDLSAEIESKQSSVNKIKAEQRKITLHNRDVAAHNSEIETIKKQIVEFQASLETNKKLLDQSKEEQAYVTILRDAFSSNGLLSYKIESSVKILEEAINEYLQEFSFFRIVFNLEKEKLNVDIISDTGEILNIETLSTGELARVNISTVLAIRKVMASFSETNINFLFLDEIVGTLDDMGKEKLSEVLLKENLNTFIVSHESTHPLIPKVFVEKKNNISTLSQE